MDKKNLINNLESILRTPTAPFHEYLLRKTIIDLLSDCKDTEISTDSFGNLIVNVGPKDKKPKWIFGAHMDHPGYVKWLSHEENQMEDFKKNGDYVFLGGVPESYLKCNFPIKEFGDFAMWDLLPYKIDEDLIKSRACDDLIGCVAIVTLIQILSSENISTPVGAVFTRAEEVGFVGATELAKNWPYCDDACFVSIETSIPTGKSKVGEGPICRLGDRLTVFDHDATESILFAAKESNLKIQRELLDLGACEASALSVFDIPVAGISLPLGNYHNCGDQNKIEEEFVSFSDLKVLINLMQCVIKFFPKGPNKEVFKKRSRFDSKVNEYRELIKQTSNHFKKTALD